jgi:hypothetical protein
MEATYRFIMLNDTTETSRMKKIQPTVGEPMSMAYHITTDQLSSVAALNVVNIASGKLVNGNSLVVIV